MILVTGATGLVGTHLLIQLVQGEVPIRALYRTEEKRDIAKKVYIACCPPNHKASFDTIEWVQGDITDLFTLEMAFKEVTYVYHCAAFISFNPSHYKILRKVNIEGTANIVNKCILHKVKKLCYVSSIAVLGESNSGNPIDETVEWNPEETHSVYAITKYGAEMEVWRGTQEGVDAVIVNPGIIIGEGFFNSGSGFLFKQIYRGMNYYTSGTTGYVAVTDVVNIMVRLVENDIKNERFIVVGENISFKNAFGMIANALGKDAPKKNVSPFVMTLAYYLKRISKIFGGKQYIFRSSIKSAFSDSFYVNEKVKKKLGYNFMSVEEAIKETAVFFRKHI